MSATATNGKQQVEWHHFDITFKTGIDMAALKDALALPDDVAYLPRAYRDRPDGVKLRLMSWGYGTAPDDPDEVGHIGHIGVYGDWTYFEDDERLMPAIAPFVLPWSMAVFALGRWSEDYQMWEFDGDGVVLRPCEKYVEWA